MKYSKNILLKSLPKMNIEEFSKEEIESIVNDKKCLFHLLKNHNNLEKIIYQKEKHLNYQKVGIESIISAFTYHYVMGVKEHLKGTDNVIHFYKNLSTEDKKKYFEHTFLICPDIAQAFPKSVDVSVLIKLLSENSVIGMKNFPQHQKNQDIISAIIESNNLKDFQHIDTDTILYSDVLLKKLKPKSELVYTFFDLYSRNKPITKENHDRLVKFYIECIDTDPKIIETYKTIEKSFHHIKPKEDILSFENLIKTHFSNNGINEIFIFNSEPSELLEAIKILDNNHQAINYTAAFFEKIKEEPSYQKKIY